MKKILMGLVITLLVITTGCQMRQESTELPEIESPQHEDGITEIQEGDKDITTSGDKNTSGSRKSSTDDADTNTSSEDERVFTMEELRTYYNGNGENPAYVAYKGKVYDVTNHEGWEGGQHFSGAKAGEDITNMFGSAPHSESVVDDLPEVGVVGVSQEN